jgi:hypothetical protein
VTHFSSSAKDGWVDSFQFKKKEHFQWWRHQISSSSFWNREKMKKRNDERV